MKENFKLQVTMIVDVEIDQDNDIVKEYENTNELLLDIVSYRFSQTLPVMKSGVVANFDEIDFKILH